MAVAWCLRTRKAEPMPLSPENPYKAFIDDLYHDREHHEHCIRDLDEQIEGAINNAEQWEIVKEGRL